MALAYSVTYHETVTSDDIPAMSSPLRDRVRRVIEKKLSTRPEMYGKPLRRSLKGYWKLRVGNYRIVYRIEKGVVKIFCIQDRSAVYKTSAKRLPK